MPAAVRIAGNLWAFPATLVGLFLAALSLGRGSRRDGVLWVVADRGFGALIARPPDGPSATTFGTVVLLWKPQRFGPALKVHELVHVGQYRRLGLFFFPLYLALLPLYGWRERHPLERPAYRREREVRDG